MGEMTEMTLEEAERQWLSEHPGCTVEDYERDIERKAQEERKRSAEEVEAAVKMIMEVLRDGNWWIEPKKGKRPVRRMAIDRISPRHARNIIGWLRRRAGFLHDIACLEFMAIPEPQGEHALDDYNSSFDQLNEMDPVEWLMQTPLVINLKAKIKAAEEEE